jgi:phosphatidate cytidylyltransferase
VAEGEGRKEGGEDLFEDLDKFFAPIQDVDWPETSEPLARPASGPPEPAEPERPTEEVEEPIRIEDLEEEEPAGEPMAGQEDLFEEPEGPISVRTETGEQVEEEDSVTSFLFQAEADEDAEELTGLDDAGPSGSPGTYVDLPGDERAIDEDETVAELAEGEAVLDEPAPDLEAVEAAADHFAESVRDEVQVEPDEGTVGSITEEVQIAALLGADEGAEAVEEAELARPVRVGQEGLGGPSWQEPTALEVGADTERRGAGRDVPLAFLTGLILAALAVGAIAIGPGAFAIFAGLAVLFAQGEFYLALQKRGFQPATALGLVSGALVLAAGYYEGEGAMPAMLALATFASFLWFMTVPAGHRRNVTANLGLTLLGIVYIPLLAGYALVTLTQFPQGRELVLSIVGLTIAYDVAAFLVGYLMGSRPLAPKISPKKSWEGAIGATLVVILIAIGAVAPAVDLLDTMGRSVGLAVVVAIFAPLGDLAESLIKRDLGIKDMGSILPGHGGVLDRIDSILFVAPAAFLYLRLILL